MKFEDFVIRIGPRQTSGYQVTVLESPAGQGKDVFEDPCAAPAGETATAPGAADRHITRIAPLAAALNTPEKTGGALFRALFGGRIGSLYDRSLGHVGRDPDCGLRIVLRFDLDDRQTARLHSLPWELLYREETREFLGLGRRSPIIRYLEVPRPIPRCAAPNRLRILAVVASPRELPPLELENEYGKIEEVCAKDPALELVSLRQATTTALRAELLRAQKEKNPCHVLHFMGHGDFDRGTGEGLLCFETEDGACDRVGGKVLSVQLRDIPELRLVVLNACDSARAASDGDPFAGVATGLVMEGIPAVVAMRLAIPDQEAIAFSAAFYQRLAAGDPVDAAVGEGRLAMNRSDPRAATWGIPALFMRRRDGWIFDRRSPFTKYLEGLSRLFAETFETNLVRPDRVYVPQFAGARADESPDEVPLLEVMNDFWQGRRRRLACLGNYGMGKTYLAWRAIHEQAARLEESEEARVPIIFPLGNFRYELAAGAGETQDLVEQIRRHVTGLGFPEIDRRGLQRLIEDGKVGIILDGLDELKIPRGVSWKTVLEPLLEIDGLHVCVTSRTAYVGKVESDLEGFEIFDVATWGEREWFRYAECSEDRLQEIGGKDRFLALIAERPRLAQLTSRPLWCFMIVSVADEIPDVGDLAISGLYQRFLDNAIKRRVLVNLILSLPWRYCAMERFADLCLREGRSSLNEQGLVRMLSGLFESIGDQELNEYLIKEARTYAFLNCGEARYYSFGHASVADYFTATGVVRYLITEATGYESGPKEHLPRTPLVAELALTEDHVDFVVGVVREEWITRALAMLPDDADYPEVRSSLVLGLQKALSEERRPAVELANLFRIYLQLLRQRGRKRRPFLQGLALRRVDLAGLDLSECDFKDTDFTEANLSATSFRGSSLERCSFFGATVDGSDFTAADLAKADLVGLEPPQVPLIAADVKNVDQARIRNRERKFFGLAAGG